MRRDAFVNSRQLAKPKKAAKAASTSLRPVPKGPLGGTAYDRILLAVVEGDYKPGDRILEDEVAGQLNISRTPVREALRRLEDDGILTHEPHRGMTVARLDFQMVQELYAVRDLLEGAAAARAARYATDADLELLENLVEREPVAAKSSATMAVHNSRFHHAMYAAAHNRYLLKTLNVLSNPLALLSRTAFGSPERRAAAMAEHRRIFEAIRAHDPEKAEFEAREHLRLAQKVRLQIFAEMKD
jgi:DNA-binding GntR family transcriptional regulator